MDVNDPYAVDEGVSLLLSQSTTALTALSTIPLIPQSTQDSI